MLPDGESEALGDRRLAILDAGIHELLDTAAVQADDVVVVDAMVELEDGHAVLEVVTGDQTGRLELRKHTVDGRQSDVLVRLEERPVDVFGRQVPRVAVLEDLQDLQPRQRYLEAGFPKVLAFQVAFSGETSARLGCGGLATQGMITRIISHRKKMRPPLTARSTAAFLASLLLGASLTGCVYRMNIQQGNYLEDRAVEQLKVGMTRSQVRYLLGTPMIPDAFDRDRWDYLYYFKKGRLEVPVQRHLVVYFKDDKVVRIERDDLPKAAKPVDSKPADSQQNEERQAAAAAPSAS